MSRNIYTSVNWAKQIAADDTHGYSQTYRLGPDYDCSSFVASALQNGGFAIDPSTTSTANLYSLLTGLGFTSVPINSARNLGHIFLVHNQYHQHCVLCTGSSLIVHASSDNGNPQTGDQTGTEIYETNYYNPSNGGWDYHLVPPADSYSGGQPTPSAVWHAQSIYGYAKTSNEAFENAIMMFNILIPLGWTVNAVAGILGNMEIESGYNPWRWQGDDILASTDPSIDTSTSHGYGLFQFTPAGKYIHSPYAMADSDYAPNFSDVTGNPNDGSAQLRFVDAHADYIPSQTYPITYADFKTSTAGADYLASAWMHNYERPASYSTEQTRRDCALWWYNTLSPYTPTGLRKKMPLWMMMKPFL